MMKRRDLVRHLEQHGCVLKREGGSHSVFVNLAANDFGRATPYLN